VTALWLALLATLVEFRCVLGAPLAAGLLGPCLAWVSYAAALTLWIAAHNPGHSSVLATGGKRITGTRDGKGQQAQGTGEEDQVSGHACVLAQTKTRACMHACMHACSICCLPTCSPADNRYPTGATALDGLTMCSSQICMLSHLLHYAHRIAGAYVLLATTAVTCNC
jgi:hypothetical protein